MRDILKLQAELAETVAKEIAVKVSDRERTRLARASRVDPQAYSAYLPRPLFMESKDAGCSAEGDSVF